MSECTHHWTVTSECPFCLREKINYRDKEIIKLKDLIRDLNTKLLEQLIVSQERFLKTEEYQKEIQELESLLEECLPHFERGQPILWKRIREMLGKL